MTKLQHKVTQTHTPVNHCILTQSWHIISCTVSAADWHRGQLLNPPTHTCRLTPTDTHTHMHAHILHCLYTRGPGGIQSERSMSGRLDAVWFTNKDPAVENTELIVLWLHPVYFWRLCLGWDLLYSCRITESTSKFSMPTRLIVCLGWRTKFNLGCTV